MTNGSKRFVRARSCDGSCWHNNDRADDFTSILRSAPESHTSRNRFGNLACDSWSHIDPVGKESLSQEARDRLSGWRRLVVILATVSSAIGTGTVSVKKSTGQFSAVLDIFVGSLLIGFGIKSALEKRSQKGQKPPVHGTASSARFARWFLLGFVLNITNFDAVLLNVMATREISQAGLLLAGAVLLTAVCDIFFLLPIVLLISVYLVVPDAAEKVLSPIAAASEKYGRHLVMMILLAFGIYLLWRGLGILI